MWLLGLYPVSFTTYRRWTYTQCVGIIRFHANGLWANTPNGSALLAATLVPTHRVLVSTSCCGLGSKIIGIKPFRIKPIDPKPYSLIKVHQLSLVWVSALQPHQNRVDVGWWFGSTTIKNLSESQLSPGSPCPFIYYNRLGLQNQENIFCGTHAVVTSRTAHINLSNVVLSHFSRPTNQSGSHASCDSS